MSNVFTVATAEATLPLWGKTSDILDGLINFCPPPLRLDQQTHFLGLATGNLSRGERDGLETRLSAGEKDKGFSLFGFDLFGVPLQQHNNRTVFWVICLNAGSPSTHRHSQPSTRRVCLLSSPSFLDLLREDLRTFESNCKSMLVWCRRENSEKAHQKKIVLTNVRPLFYHGLRDIAPLSLRAFF